MRNRRAVKWLVAISVVIASMASPALAQSDPCRDSLPDPIIDPAFLYFEGPATAVRTIRVQVFRADASRSGSPVASMVVSPAAIAPVANVPNCYRVPIGSLFDGLSPGVEFELDATFMTVRGSERFEKLNSFVLRKRQ